MSRAARTLTLAAAVLAIALLAVAAPAHAAPPAATRPPRPTADDARTPLQSMVAAERAFAKRAADTNVREAFLAYLAPHSIVLQPLPVDGRKTYEARKPNTARLVWEPEYGEVAASGDFGVSSGPWEFTPPGDSTGARKVYGTFLSIWTRDGRNPWQVALDGGVWHPKPSAAIAFEAGPDHAVADAATKPPATATVEALDRSLSAAAGDAAALRPWVADDARFLRAGEMPRRGDAARDAIAATPRGATWQPMGGGVARSGDLGYTYGVRIDAAPDAGGPSDSTAYVHVWRRVDPKRWKLSAAADSPITQK